MKDIVYFFWNLLNRIMRFVVFQVLHLKISDEKWTAFLQFEIRDCGSKQYGCVVRDLCDFSPSVPEVGGFYRH